MLTGKRGGFGALITLMKAIEADPEMRLDLITTDMHHLPQFGETVREVKKWFKRVHELPTHQKNDSSLERARALSRTMSGALELFAKLKPDILVTLGDRGEVLAAVTAALELNIPVAHILGGDVAGNRDGVRIHAITKLAHLHFPANRDAYKRILKLGEDRSRVFDFGSTYIDLVVRKTYTPNAVARKKYNVAPTEPYAICIQHPTTLNERDSYTEAKVVYEALRQRKMRTVIVWPCSDQGYAGVLEALKEYTDVPYFSMHKNIEALDFWGLMEGATFMIGNSSSGLMETPYFKIPSVSIGRRQDGRARDSNVIQVRKVTVPQVNRAISAVLSPRFKSKLKNHNVFGRGNAGKRIARILKHVQLGDALLQKNITF